MTAQSVDGEKIKRTGNKRHFKSSIWNFTLYTWIFTFHTFTWNFKFHTLYLKFKFHTLHLKAKMPTWKLWVSSSPPWSSSSGMNDTMLLLIYMRAVSIYISAVSSNIWAVSCCWCQSIYEQFQIRWICAKRSRNNESYETTSASSYI